MRSNLNGNLYNSCYAGIIREYKLLTERSVILIIRKRKMRVYQIDMPSSVNTCGRDARPCVSTLYIASLSYIIMFIRVPCIDLLP